MNPSSPGAHDPGNLLKKKKQNKTLSTKVQTELQRKQKNQGKKKKKKEGDREVRQRVERRDRKWDYERDPLSALTHADDTAAAHAHAVSPWVRDAVKLVSTASPSWSCHRCESVTASCYHRWDPRETHLPPPVAQSAQPSFVDSAFTVHRYLLLSFPSKPNKMFMTLWSENLRFIESRNCACVVRTFGLDLWCFNFHVWVFCRSKSVV